MRRIKLPNGYGSVYKLQGNRRRPFAVAVTVGLIDGRYKRRMLGYYATRKEALAALSEYNRNPYDLDAATMTLAEMFDKWKEYREGRKKPPSQGYTSAFRHCEKYHKTRFSDIGPVQIQDMVDNAPSPVLAQRIKGLFNMIYKYAILTGISTTSPTAAIELPKRPKSTMHKPFTEEEISQLWERQEDFSARLALVYCYTGLRPMELIHIKRADVHLAERYMVGGMKTDAGKNRTIPIAEKILPIIETWYNQDGEYLVPVRRRANNIVLDIFKASEVPAVAAHLPHDGRHTCETMLDNARVSKRTIQLILGHAGRDIDEDVYTHKTRQQLIDAINMI